MRYLLALVVAVVLAACSEPTAPVLPRDGSTASPSDSSSWQLPRTTTF